MLLTGDAIPDLKAVAVDDEVKVEPFPAAAGLDTVWQLMFLLTAVAAPLVRAWVLSKQLMETTVVEPLNKNLFH